MISILEHTSDVFGTDDVVCWMGEVVVVLGFVVIVVDGGDIVDVFVGELVFDVVESGDDVVVTFGEMVETRVVGVVDIPVVVVVVLGFVVVCDVVGEAVVVVFAVDGGDIVDVVLDGAFVVDDDVDLFVVVVGELVFDVVESGDDVVVTFGEMVETRVVGAVDISSRVWPHILMFVMEA